MRYALILSAALFAPAHGQQPSLTFDGCVDSAGRPVPAVPDGGQREFVRVRDDGGRLALVYNPDALAERSEATRSFLFAQACARINLGLPATGISAADAHRADCWGLETLRRSRLIIDPDGVAAVQADLDLSADEWSRLPGPERRFELASCQRQAIRLPSADRPDADRRALNACLHGCGDRLFRCQGGALSVAGDCMRVFDACEADCGR
ncbi:MAG: hypothetical protein KDH15_01880 [Rhodocyclaceae bacterium]|nr:hypothetical protein [Rhodocyclaceae bacterium]